MYKTRMGYFGGLRFHEFNELPRCNVWLDASLPHYALNFVCAGSIRFREPGAGWIEIKGPAAFCTCPGIRYQYGVHPPNPWHHFYVTFSGRRAGAMLRSGFFPASRRGAAFVAVAEAAEFRRGFDALFRELSRNPAGNAMAVHQLEGLLLGLAHSPESGRIEEGSARRIVEVVAEIEAAPGSLRDFGEIAASFGWSPAHFRREFRKMMRLPPVAFHNRARLGMAAGLLRSSDLPIKEIADRCGISDVYYFSKLFRRTHGRPPGEYRRVFQLRQPGPP